MRVVTISKDRNNTTEQEAETFSLSMRGKLGYSAGCGLYKSGVAFCGDSNTVGGVYVERPGGYNQFGKSANFSKRTIKYRKTTYRPTNPQTVDQQAHRSKLTDGVTAWQALTNDQRSAYNVRGSKVARRGYNIFISEFIKAAA